MSQYCRAVKLFNVPVVFMAIREEDRVSTYSSYMVIPHFTRDCYCEQVAGPGECIAAGHCIMEKAS